MSKRMHKAHHEQKNGLPRWVIGAGLGLVAVIAVAAVILLGGGQDVTQTEEKTSPDFTPVAGIPRLAVDQDTLDYGDVKFEEPVSASFRLTNVGDQPLQLPRNPAVELVEGC